MIGARKDNPTVCDAGYNDNTIRNQKVYQPIPGNVHGNATTDISNEQKKPRKASVICEHHLKIIR